MVLNSTGTSDEIIKVLEYLFGKFGIVVDWANDDVIPYIQELGEKIVAYKAGIATVWIVVAAVLAVIGIICFIGGLIDNGIDSGWVIIAFVFLATATIIAIINIYTLVACNTFPEKIILDYVKDYMQMHR